MSSMKQDFDVEQFESKLENLKDTQDGIQQMSSWCLQQRVHHKKIVASWLNVFKKVRVEHRLVLFYLANDVIQYSKRKRYEYVESWATALQRATTMVRDDKVRNKIFRIFKIWEQRGIYSEEYLSDLSGLLSMNPSKKSQATTSAEVNPEEFQVAKVAESASHRANDFSFQSATLISNIRDCVELSSVTDKSFKNLPKAPNCDIENIKTALKDKSHSDDVEKELDRYVTNVDTHRKHLASEIRSRKAVMASLEAAIAFYSTQRGEVKVVVSAYKNFGSRIKLVKKKLDEITPNLPSPIPSPDINAPSPEPDSDSNLPDEQNPSMLIFKNTFNGYTSYLDGKLPFDINDFKRDTTSKKNALSGSQKIEVIASRSDSETLNDSFNGPEFYKPQPLNPMGSINPYSASSITLPLPTGQPEYSSLARPAASNYTAAALSYGGHSSNRYNPMVPNYASDSNYISNSSNSSYDASMPLMPPPMPPSLSGSSGGSGNGSGNGNSQGDDFNSTWDNVDMSWNAADTPNPFNCAGPLSPARFDREGILDESTTEYDDRESDMRPMRDVDHRQLHLPAVPAITNLGPSKDIDHRNLISLTGSPTPREIEDKYSRSNKTWIAPKDKDFRTPMPVRAPGDSDYRSLSDKVSPAPHPPLKPPPMLTGLLSFSQAQEADASQEYIPGADNFDTKVDEQGYDPSDMVESIDMDMSDEDLEDIFREVASVENEIKHQTNQNNQEHASSEEHDNQQQHDEYVPQAPEETLKTVKPIPYRDNLIPVANSRPPLLDTPPNNNNNSWESPQGVQPPNRFPPGFEDHSVQNIGDNGILNTPMRPPINPWKQAPRMPFRIPGPLENHQPPPPGGFHHPVEFQHHQQFQRFPRSPFGQPPRNFGPQNHFRGSPRPPRGNPFFNKSRGRGGGPPGVGPVPRPNVFRGKFRGNPWQ